MPFDPPEPFAPTPLPAFQYPVAPVQQRNWENSLKVMGAALRLENPIFSVFSRKDLGLDNDEELGYSVYDDIKGTEFEKYLPAFVGIRNSRLAAARKYSIMQLQQDSQTTDAAGWEGWVAKTVSGQASPTTFIPGVGLVKNAEGVYSISRSALRIGALNALGTTLDESVLQGTQETRTWQEGAMAVGTSAVLGGLLGAAASGLAKAPYARAAKGLSDFADRINPRAPLLPDQLQSVVDNISRQLGVPERITVRLVDDFESGARGRIEFHANPEGTELIGATISIAKGSNAVMVESLGHEYGHFIAKALLRRAPEREAIMEAFRREYADLSDKSIEEIIQATMTPARRDMELGVVANRRANEIAPDFGPAAEYRLRFEEWFANQTAKWIASNAAPRNVVERFFADVAAMWKKVYENVTGKPPVAKEVEDFLRNRMKLSSKQEALPGKVVGFKTAKGSTYTVDTEGKTTRNKAARTDPGHEGDSGLKPASARTIYLDSGAADLSAAGLSNVGPKGARVIIKDGRASLLMWNDAEDRWGIQPSGKDIPFHLKPAVGREPLELWKKVDDVPGYEAYSNMHAGNKITELMHEDANIPVGPGSVGAEAVAHAPPREEMNVAGVLANAWDKATAFLTPGSRLGRSVAKVARWGGELLADRAVATEMTRAGRTFGPSAERRFKTEYISATRDWLTGYRDAYTESWKAGDNLTRQQFGEAVADAMRAGDAPTGNPHIDRAVAASRAYTDKIAQRAAEEGIIDLPEKLKGAHGWFHRDYNTRKLRAERGKFEESIRPFLNDLIVEAHAVDKVDTLAKMAQMKAEADALELPREGRPAALAQLEQKVSDFIRDNPELDAALQNVQDLQTALEIQKETGNIAKVKELKNAIAERMQATPELKQFSQSLRNFRKIRNAILKTERRDSLADEIRDKLADTEEKMESGLVKLVDEWKKLEKELASVDEEGAAEKLSKFKDRFASAAQRLETSEKQTKGLLDKVDKEIESYNEKAKKIDQSTPGALQKIKALQDEAARVEAELAPTRKILQAKHEEQRKLAASMNLLAQNIERAELFDPAYAKQQIDEAFRILKAEGAGRAWGVADRAQRLQEKLARLDPEEIKAAAAQKRVKAQELEDKFLTKWETKRLVDDPLGDAPNFDNLLKETVDDVYGNVSQQFPKEKDEIRPGLLKMITRGPLKDRTLPIPDEILKPWLNNDAEQVLRHWGRVVVGETELAALDRRMGGDGDPNLPRMQELLKNDYEEMQRGIVAAQSVEEIKNVTGPQRLPKNLEAARSKALDRLDKSFQSDSNDLLALRDMLRGTYLIEENMSDWGRVARALNMFNFARLGGGFGISSIGDVFRGAFALGIGKYVDAMNALRNTEVSPALRKEIQATSLASNSALHYKTASLGEMMDPLSNETGLEKLLRNAAQFTGKWSGLNLLQDWAETVTGLRLNDMILSGEIEAGVAARAGLNAEGLRRIHEQFAQFGKNEDGVHIANTELWTDKEAVMLFRNAVGKATQEIAVSPGIAEVPLMAHTPLGSLFFLFKRFNLASQQRVLMKGLQGDPQAFVSTIVGLTAIGMMVSWMKAVGRGNEGYEKWKQKDFLEWVEEGLDNSGVFTLAFEASNVVEKATLAMMGGKTAFNPLKEALTLGSYSPAKRFPDDFWAEIGGPSIGLASDVLSAAGTAGRVGGRALGMDLPDTTMGERRRAMAVLPFVSSFPILKDMTQVLNDDHPWIR